MPFTAERRREIRIPLDTLYFVNISFNSQESTPCMILNVSNGGIMIDLASNLAASLVIGSSASFVDNEYPLDFLASSEGTVMWVREGLCGIAFKSSVDLPPEFAPEDFK